MAELLTFLALLYVAVGVSRAVANERAARHLQARLLADPSAAAERMLHLLIDARRQPFWRRWAVAALRFPMEVTSWPVREFWEDRDRRGSPDYQQPEFRDPRWRGTMRELSPEYASLRARRFSTATGCLSLVLVAAAALRAPVAETLTITAIAWVVVLSVMARQGTDLLSGKLLSTVARRSDRPLPRAYLDLLVAALADGLALTSCSVLLLRWHTGERLQVGWFRTQVVELLNGHHVTHLPRAFAESPSAALVGIAAFTFYASVIVPIQGAWRKQSGDDLMAAAEGALRRGRLGRARGLIERGRSRNPSAKALNRAQGLLALANGDAREAWVKAQALVRLYRPEVDLDRQRQHEDGLFVLVNWCEAIGIAPRPGALELARELPVRDCMMAWFVAQHADVVLPRGLDPGARVAALAEVMNPSAWPLTFALAEKHDGRLDAAISQLPDEAGLSELDLLWRRQLARGLRIDLELRDGDLTEEEIPARIVADAQALLADVATSDLATWPEWHRLAFAGALSAPLMIRNVPWHDNPDTAKELIAKRNAVTGDDGTHTEIGLLHAVQRRSVSNRSGTDGSSRRAGPRSR